MVSSIENENRDIISGAKAEEGWGFGVLVIPIVLLAFVLGGQHILSLLYGDFFLELYHQVDPNAPEEITGYFPQSFVSRIILGWIDSDLLRSCA